MRNIAPGSHSTSRTWRWVPPAPGALLAWGALSMLTAYFLQAATVSVPWWAVEQSGQWGLGSHACSWKGTLGGKIPALLLIQLSCMATLKGL